METTAIEKSKQIEGRFWQELPAKSGQKKEP